MSKAARLDLPGFSLPLEYAPDTETFPNALDPDQVEDEERFDTLREILMRQVMNSIIDKPEYSINPRFLQVFDDEITAKWREEVANSGRDVSPKMMDWIFKELQWKADYLDKNGMVMVFDTGVIISDSAISLELQQELRAAVKPLEMDPKKDFHPGSEEKVVDLVHPSLFPVIYSRSRILPDRLIDLDDCLNYIGEGQLLPMSHKTSSLVFSTKFQWMPCDVEFSSDGGCHIVSYINNLHPRKNRPLYKVVEKLIVQAIPMWNLTLSNVNNDKHRIDYDGVEYDPCSPSSSYSDWEEKREIVQPEPGDFDPKVVTPENGINLREDYTQGLQVIVKLANIELTPEKPEYHGGSWHVEGALNEHICATAIYYYESDNITESSLAFRQRALREDIRYLPPQDEFDFLQEVLGFDEDVKGRGETRVTQDLGSISTREGRLLTFPNNLQHCVSPFALANSSKPGHRKILALFLVDPNYRIISSANVPPQREDWWEERKEGIINALPQRLPLELKEMVVQNMDVSHISMEEACQYRLELMQERTATTEIANEVFELGDFSLCEH
ncbi:DUF4246 domain-containing protein [Aspergillus lucknowensis]|uniref:Uncharacterized protein n=1 Tax=Aspergillus lucknowensis TaxID=176173 RepID=A0ABR4LQA1_9EURO